MTRDRISAARSAPRAGVSGRAPSSRLAGGTLVVLALLCGPAAASDGNIPAPGRFDMHPSPDGVLRLDRVTGEIALCATADGAAAWTCRTVVAGAVAEPVRDAPAQAQGAGDSRAQAAAAREQAIAAGREAVRRLALGAADAPEASPSAGDAGEARGQDPAEGSTRAELERLRQENARLTARVDELGRRLTHVAALSGTDVTRADSETDEAIADIDRVVRVGIYALARFRDLAETLGSDEPTPRER